MWGFLKNDTKSLQKYPALLIQKVQDTHLGLYEVDTGLIVVEIDQSPGDLFFHVLLLLQLEYMHVELLLEFLIGIVDTELLKAVDFKCLKPNKEEQMSQ